MLMDRKYIHKIILDLEGILLEPQESVKLLGIGIDRMFTFDKHINTICKCTGKLLSVLHRLSKDVGHNEINRLISQLFIMSNMSYCPVICLFCSRVMEYKVE